jgi:ABC-type nitrate/sulfonate/bicarbonate transport system ATPase subunit/ABC-type nitrate/sulfonate/bicarbonate transport system permease component
MGFLLLLWELASRLAGSDLIFPGPLQVLRQFIRIAGTPGFFLALVHSFFRVILGTGIAAPLGLGIGIAAGLDERAAAFFKPFFSVIAATPVMSVILIAFLALGAERTPVFTGFLMVFPVAAASASEGIASVDAGLRELFRVFSLPRNDRFRYLYMPSVMPFMLAALRSGLSLCWKAVAAAEVLVQPLRGLGTDMQRAKAQLETPELFAWTAAAVTAAALSQMPLSLLGRLLPRAFHLKAAHAGAAAEAPAGGKARIRIENLSFGFGGVGEKPLFDNFSLSLGEENPAVILGPSGCGKTTLLRLMAGLASPWSGAASAGDEDYLSEKSEKNKKNKKARRISFVFQEPRLLPWLTVWENALLPVKNILRPKEAEERASRFLKMASLTDKAGAYPDALSGGEKQRAALARAFIYPAGITFLDEPFQSLDIPLRMELMEMTLRLLKAEPRLLVAVTHDPREAVFLGRRIIVLGAAPRGIVFDGQGRAYGSPEAGALEGRLLQALCQEVSGAGAEKQRGISSA